MATVMQQIIGKLEDTSLTMFDIYSWMQMHKGRLLQEERKQIINFHIEVMKEGLIHEGDKTWKDAYHPKIKEQAEKQYNKLLINK